MRVLFLGDIVGSKVISVLEKNISYLKNKYKYDLLFCNAENVSNGSGLKLKDYKRLMHLKVQGVTMGNHAHGKDEIVGFYKNSNISMPANLDEYYKHYKIYNYNNKKICVINLLGKVFMHFKKKDIHNPFLVLDEMLKEIKADYIIIDIHAEATSEKVALFHAFKGKVDAILGTHTHVQTADECVLGNTLYITDLGKCGAVNSVLGLDINQIVERFKTDTFQKADLASGNIEICGALLDFDTRVITRMKEVFNEEK